ncbi:MAG: DUF3095 domain-containing protein [Oscillatoria sp. SIO1A7]|nr:DUF3095 domain-containing protein [Oscillatoria sp. SIO1A7]
MQLMLSTENFYWDLPALDNFLDIADHSHFVGIPDDWYVIVTDIVGSTKAIEAGRYKEVNFLGASSIVALLNIAGELEIPFVFGGDGASILIPPCLLEAAKPALLATQAIAKKEFNLGLRIGAVPVADVCGDRYEVKVAKVRVDRNYSQAVFIGGGLTYATDLVKDPATSDRYNIQGGAIAESADFSGLECRWQDIPSKHGEIVSLLVMAREAAGEQAIYKEVLEHIYRIYGSDDNLNPIFTENLNLTFDAQKLNNETKVRAAFGSRLQKQLYLWKITVENALSSFLCNAQITVGAMNWGELKEETRSASDYRKFDDMLRMIISSDAAKREQLSRYLEEQYQKGNLVYGLQVSDRALMTCLVFERAGRQVHFVDGADGGYALAAKAMKARWQRMVERG